MAERRFSEDLAFPLVVAHRGASADEPENTLGAFEAAVIAGADAVEFDVRMSADGHAVVMHDPDVDRTTDGHGLVKDLSLLELKRLRVRSSSTDSAEWAEIPTLAETLAMLSSRASIDVEIKNLPGEPDHEPERERAVEATLRALDAAAFVGSVLLSSFNPRSIARARELASDVPAGLLVAPAMPIEDALALVVGGGHTWVLPAAAAVLAAGRMLVETVHAAGLRIGTWIVDDPDTAILLTQLGLDAIATNDPRTVVPVVTAARPR